MSRSNPSASSTLTAFTGGWTFRREADSFSVPIELPHDAMLVEGRSASSAMGAHGSHFLGGRYVYSKRWTAPENFRDRKISLFFEGIYGKSEVVVNGTTVATSVSGYTEFDAVLDDNLIEGENLIEVHVDNSQTPNSRWYTGSGIYRRVWLRNEAPVRFARDGIRFVTASISPDAVLDVEVLIDNPSARPAQVRVALADEWVAIAETTLDVQDAGHVVLTVPSPTLWSAETPHLYTASVQLTQHGEILDERTVAVGLRVIETDSAYGLRVNGKTVKLRGANVHHDSGVLGAATFRVAEFRRARILKESGFNAIRSAHNPISRDLIDACDEIGLYVMDELTDVWSVRKTKYDSAPHFATVWRTEATAMVAKDRNHASVIMYSIGNEIGETGTAAGIELSGDLSRFIKQLDATRPTTIGVNFLLNVMASMNSSPFKPEEHANKPAKANSTAANVIANKIGSVMHLVARLPRADKTTKDVFANVDVAGYNYGASRHRGDAKRYPDRVMVGSETMPGDIAHNWEDVLALPSLIGDFMWTGWDYLGEAGIGTWGYGKGASVMNQPYPHLVAGSGAIDITGLPGAPTLLNRAVWGKLDAPAIAVRPMDHAGEATARSAWRGTDAIPSWAWRGAEGRTASIEVYSDDDQVELVLNGRSLGRKRAGRKHGFITKFTAPYEPGELVAIGRTRGRPDRRSSLRSSQGELRLRLSADRAQLDHSGQDLAFIVTELVDSHGVVEMLASDSVTVEVNGAGTLAGLGSGANVTAESYLSDTFTTYYGRALAVVRAGTAVGRIQVTATSVSFGTSTTELDVAEISSDHPVVQL